MAELNTDCCARAPQETWGETPSLEQVRETVRAKYASAARGEIREAARVLRLGGRFAVSDVIADPDMDEHTRADTAAWTGCIAGALTVGEFRSALEAAGFGEIEITETHRVHEHAGSAIVRARKL